MIGYILPDGMRQGPITIFWADGAVVTGFYTENKRTGIWTTTGAKGDMHQQDCDNFYDPEDEAIFIKMKF